MREGAAKLDRFLAEPGADPIDRMFETSRGVELALEQGGRIGGAAVEEIICADPDQSEPGDAVDLGGQQAGCDVKKRIGQLRRIRHAAGTRSQAKIGGLQFQGDRTGRQ
jgi:hypothetical protein